MEISVLKLTCAREGECVPVLTQSISNKSVNKKMSKNNRKRKSHRLLNMTKADMLSNANMNYLRQGKGACKSG